MDGIEENTCLKAGPESFPPAASLLDFIEGELQPPKPSLLYRLSLTVLAFAMILLPAIYFCIVGIVAYGVYYYATHYYTILGWEVGYRGTILLILLYFGPLFIGITLTFFLIKPIFSRRSDEDQYYSLNFADAPQLFTFIGWICRSLNAPIPSRIDVDCNVNASAGFRSGWRSLFGNDIVLTIGLPLVAGMTLEQFAGVLAHEYGHFSQGTATRACYIVRAINLWFSRVVYERDEWDYSLEAALESQGQRPAFTSMFYLTGLGVWTGRGILKGLMIVGRFLSSFMARQMEFDADRYWLKMSGTQTFLSTTQRLIQLDLGFDTAKTQLRNKWKKEGKLFDLLPELIVSCANQIPAEAQNQLLNFGPQKKGTLFDSHPSDAERIKRARKANEPGIFHHSGPATCLFANFPELSRKVTLAQYEIMTGAPFPPNKLDSTEEVVREYDYSEDQQRIKNYFLGIATSLRPVIIPESRPLVFRGAEDLISDIRKARRQMEEMLPAALKAYNALKSADEQILLARQARSLLQAGYVYNPADYGLDTLNVEDALAMAQGRFNAASGDLEEFDAIAKSRLLAALQLLRLPFVAASIPDAVKLQDHAKQMIWTLSRLADIFTPLLELRRECATLESLLQSGKTDGSGENSASEIDNLHLSTQELLNGIQQTLGSIQYPFLHGGQNISVSDYARNKEYHSDPVQLVLREGNSHVEKLITLYYRLLGNLIFIAETVESHTVDKQA